MNSRGRVIKAIEFGEPDGVPNGCYTLAPTPGRRADAMRRLFERHPSDFAEVQGMARWFEWSDRWKRGEHVDEWGCRWRNLQDGVLGQWITHPLADWENLRAYQFPDPLDGMEADHADMEEIQDGVHKAGHDKYFLARGGSIWQKLHALRGFENTMVDIIQGRRELLTLLDRLVNYNLRRLKPILELDNIDGVMFGDDWGTRNRLFIRLKQWRRYFKPAYKKMFDFVRRKGRHVFLHSDGYIMDIIPDLIEMGCHAVNIQTNLNGQGVEDLRPKFGGKICLAADVDRQHTLPFGTASEVRNLVKNIILGFKGLNGGLILYGEIGPDVSLENAESMLKALENYGNSI